MPIGLCVYEMLGTCVLIRRAYFDPRGLVPVGLAEQTTTLTDAGSCRRDTRHGCTNFSPRCRPAYSMFLVVVVAEVLVKH